LSVPVSFACDVGRPARVAECEGYSGSVVRTGNIGDRFDDFRVDEQCPVDFQLGADVPRMVPGRHGSAVWPRGPNGIVAVGPSNLLQGVVVQGSAVTFFACQRIYKNFSSGLPAGSRHSVFLQIASVSILRSCHCARQRFSRDFEA